MNMQLEPTELAYISSVVTVKLGYLACLKHVGQNLNFFTPRNIQPLLSLKIPNQDSLWIPANDTEQTSPTSISNNLNSKPSKLVGSRDSNFMACVSLPPPSFRGPDWLARPRGSTTISVLHLLPRQ